MPWTENNHKLKQEFSFKDFKTGLDFVNKIGQIAEKIGHHPDIFLSWGKVKVETTTHDQGGKITDLDRQLAQMIDNLFVEFSHS